MRLTKAQADLWTAPLLFALGAATTVGGYRMDRLEIRQIHPASIPGLTPMLLGLVLMVCAVLLFFEARGRVRGAAEPSDAEGTSTPALILAGGLCLVYALIFIGTLPYWLATTLFVGGFAAIFGWDPAASRGRNLRTAALSLVFGLIVAAAIAALFRYGFLVRLP